MQLVALHCHQPAGGMNQDDREDTKRRPEAFKPCQMKSSWVGNDTGAAYAGLSRGIAHGPNNMCAPPFEAHVAPRLGWRHVGSYGVGATSTMSPGLCMLPYLQRQAQTAGAGWCEPLQ